MIRSRGWEGQLWCKHIPPRDESQNLKWKTEFGPPCIIQDVTKQLIVALGNGDHWVCSTVIVSKVLQIYCWNKLPLLRRKWYKLFTFSLIHLEYFCVLGSTITLYKKQKTPMLLSASFHSLHLCNIVGKKVHNFLDYF